MFLCQVKLEDRKGIHIPMQIDIAFYRSEDGLINVSMTPPVAISGWSLQFQLMHRYGGVVPLINKYCASGFNNVSGINVTNGNLGVFNVALNQPDTSGLVSKNYFASILRTDSGSFGTLAEGIFSLLPGGG